MTKTNLIVRGLIPGRSVSAGIEWPANQKTGRAFSRAFCYFEFTLKPYTEKANLVADFKQMAELLLKSFFEKASGPFLLAKIEMKSDLLLQPETKDSFSCSVELKQGAKKLPPEKIYVSFNNFPMVKFFGRTWTEFQGEPGIAPFLTSIQDHFRHLKA